MKSVIFDEQMIMELQETGTAAKLSKVKPQPINLFWGGWILDSTGNEKDIGKAVWLDQYPLSTKEVRIRCPHGGVGDVLRVRETWCIYLRRNRPFIQYKAGGEEVAISYERYEHLQFNKRRITWRPSILMPRWASRYTVQCTAVSVEQINGQWHWRNEYALVKEA